MIYFHTSQITINVVANEPVKLVPDSQLPTPVVSYSTAINSRTLLSNVALSIVVSSNHQRFKVCSF